MRRHAKAPSAGSPTGTGTSRARKTLFGMACLCAVALVAFLGSGAPSAGAVEACPNEEFRKGLGALLPDCRAYEQVSPVDKNGFDAGVTGSGISVREEMGGPVSPDGSTTGFVSEGAFAGSAWGGTGNLRYLSHRDGAGWSTRPLMPAPKGSFTTSFAQEILALDTSMEHSLIVSSIALQEGQPSDSFHLYRQDNLTGALLPAFSGPPDMFITSVQLASADLGHLVLSSKAVLTAEPGQPDSSVLKVYDYDGAQLRLVSREPDGTPIQMPSQLGSGTPEVRIPAVSEDGNHIFFTVVPGTEIGTLYRRSGGTVTELATPSKRTVPDPAGTQPVRFMGATPDGNRAFFRSAEMLTDDANDPSLEENYEGDLYRYDFAADELVDLSVGTEGSQPARVEGVLDFSDDGDRIYYVAYGQVVPGEGVDGQPNLYLWEDDGTPDGSTRYIATLDGAAGGALRDELGWSWKEDKTAAQATPDGSKLLFQSLAGLAGNDTAGTSQVYLYDAEANGGAGRLSCVSCNAQPPANHAFAPSSLAPFQETGVIVARDDAPTAISDDGSRIAFSSPDPLLARDTNDAYDAYLWEDGELSLLSSGASNRASYTYGLSASGDDAFFKTAEQLVPQDGDTSYDIYTAHVNGGFLSQQQIEPPSCSGEECHGAGPQPPAGPAPLTSSFQGPGNPPLPPRRCGRGKRRVKAANGRTRCVKKRRHRANRNRRAGR